MKSFLLLAIALTTAQVQAGSLNADFRADMLSQKYNDAALAGGTGTGTDNYRFMMQTGRLDYKGTLSEQTNYRVRVRFSGKTQGAMELRDNTNPTLDFAYATHKFSDLFRLTMGKYSGDNGGFEGTTAGPDVYFFSEAFTGGGYLGRTQTGGPANGLVLKGHSANLLYIDGAKLSFVLSPEHTINLMVADLDANVGRGAAVSSDVTVGGLTSQNKSLIGASYFGSFMDKTMSVIASYHTQTLIDDVNQNWAAIGLSYTAGPLVVQGDYLMNTYNSVVGAFKPKDTLTSTVLKVVYNIDPTLAVQAKFVASDEKFDTTSVVSSTNKYTSYGAAIEWKPRAEDVFRYHAAYNSRNEAPDLGDSRQLNEVIVGMRINADILK